LICVRVFAIGWTRPAMARPRRPSRECKDYDYRLIVRRDPALRAGEQPREAIFAPGERERPWSTRAGEGKFPVCASATRFLKSPRVSNFVQTPFFNENNLRRQVTISLWAGDGTHGHFRLLPRPHRLLDARNRLARWFDHNHAGDRRSNRRLRIQDRIAVGPTLIGRPMQKALAVLPMAAGLPSFLRHGNSPSWCRLLLVAPACNVTLAAVAWFLCS
jgi:hypothetical protein